MPYYELYYWGLPFHGNFIQLFLEEVRAHGSGVLYETRPTPRQFSFQP